MIYVCLLPLRFKLANLMFKFCVWGLGLRFWVLRGLGFGFQCLGSGCKIPELGLEMLIPNIKQLVGQFNMMWCDKLMGVRAFLEQSHCHMSKRWGNNCIHRICRTPLCRSWPRWCHRMGASATNKTSNDDVPGRAPQRKKHLAPLLCQLFGVPPAIGDQCVGTIKAHIRQAMFCTRIMNVKQLSRPRFNA